jgi:septum formation protein
MASNVAERRSAAAPSAEALLLAEKKAMAVCSSHRRCWILGADTVVVLEEMAFGKPGDHEEARSMLSLLSGKEHKVITAFCVLDPTGRTAHSEAVTTLVKMKNMTEEEIRAYVATGEPLGKAGSYAIQGMGTFMIESISGSYTNVVGLPVCALIKCLLATGALKRYPLSP